MKNSLTKILIVEDQVISSMTIEENLQALGYAVTDVIAKGEDVLGAIKKDQPDLILMDINLKGKATGIEAAEMVLKEYNIPIIYLTASSNDKTFKKAITTQPFGYLTKPFVPKELGATIELALYKHSIEKKLLKSEQILKEAQAIGKIGHWELDIVENSLYWSDEIYNIFNIDKDAFEATYESFLSFIHPDEVSMVDEAYQRSIKNKEVYDIKHRILLPDGTIKYVHEKCIHEFDRKGNPVKSLGTVQDITREEVAKQKLIKSEALLTEAQRLGKIGSWEYNLVTGDLEWSDEIYNIFELDKEEFNLSYLAFLNFIHRDDLNKLDDKYTKSVENKTPFEEEHRIVLKNGTIKHVRQKCETIYNSEGKPVTSIGTIQDITLEKLSKEKLEQSEKNFKDLFINSIDEVYLVDIDTFQIVNVNHAVLFELGYTDKEIKKIRIDSIAANKADLKKVVENIKQLTYHNSFQVKTEHRRKDGSIYPVDIKFKKTIYSGKELILAQARNITSILELEKKKEDEIRVRSVLNNLLSITLEDKSVKEFLDEALELIISLPYFEKLTKAAIFRVKDDETIKLTSHVNFDELTLEHCSTLKKGEGICGSVFETKDMQHAGCEGFECDVFCGREKLGNYVIPILNKNIILGVLNIYLSCEHGRDEAELDVLNTIANTLGIILMRKKNQEALKESESRFRELTETIKEVFWLQDWKTYDMLYVSPSYEEIYENTCENLYKNPHSWNDRLHPEDRKYIMEEYNKAGDGSFNVEFRLLFDDGRIKWVHERAFPIIENGEVVRMAGYSVDITERKTIEEELRLSEEKYRTYVENSADVITITDENFIVQFNTPNNPVVFGYDKDENVGINAINLIHPDDVSSFNTSFKNLQRQNAPKSFQFRYKHKTKGWVWIESSIRYVDEETRKPYFIINSRDISGRRKIEEELIESELRYRSLFENSLSGVYRISMDKKIIECNDAFAKMIGFDSRNEVIGKLTEDLYESEADFFELLDEEKGKLNSFENFIKLKNKNKRVRLLENASIVNNVDGKPLYYEGSLIDTTSLLEIEKEKKAFEIIPAENPNPVFRINYDFEILYANHPGKKLLAEISKRNTLRNTEIARSVQKIVSRNEKDGNIEFKIQDKVYMVYVSNIQEYEYVNIYAADVTELKQTQADYHQLTLDLEQLVEERTKELNRAVAILNKEVQDRKKAEKEARKSLSEKEVLLNEITHRVKNNLQVIASLLNLQKESIKNKETFQMLADTGHRIKSMALIHETLYKSSDFSMINIRNYIESLVTYISNSFDTSYINISCDVDDLDLTIDTATSCGMIVMELITNSLKYAFREGEFGEVKLKMTRKDKDYYKLLVEDNGKGYPKDINFSSTKTLGMQLVTGLTAQLQGEITKMASEGTSFEIVFKDTKRHKYE